MLVHQIPGEIWPIFIYWYYYFSIYGKFLDCHITGTCLTFMSEAYWWLRVVLWVTSMLSSFSSVN